MKERVFRVLIAVGIVLSTFVFQADFAPKSVSEAFAWNCKKLSLREQKYLSIKVDYEVSKSKKEKADLDWGDGSFTSVTKNRGRIKHDYAEGGNYTIRLRVWNEANTDYRYCELRVTVEERPTPTPTLVPPTNTPTTVPPTETPPPTEEPPTETPPPTEKPPTETPTEPPTEEPPIEETPTEEPPLKVPKASVAEDVGEGYQDVWQEAGRDSDWIEVNGTRYDIVQAGDLDEDGVLDIFGSEASLYEGHFYLHRIQPDGLWLELKQGDIVTIFVDGEYTYWRLDSPQYLGYDSVIESDGSIYLGSCFSDASGWLGIEEFELIKIPIPPLST